MHLSLSQKNSIKNDIITALRDNDEVDKIIIFGSFNTADNPDDIDIALFEDSNDNYLTLAMKYRKQLRHISKILPIDIIPLKKGTLSFSFVDEINNGTVIYER